MVHFVVSKGTFMYSLDWVLIEIMRDLKMLYLKTLKFLLQKIVYNDCVVINILAKIPSFSTIWEPYLFCFSLNIYDYISVVEPFTFDVLLNLTFFHFKSLGSSTKCEIHNVSFPLKIEKPQDRLKVGPV